MKPQSTDLVANLHYVRVRACQPFCWLLKVPSLPWLSKRAEAERDHFLVRMLSLYKAAAWGIDPINFGTENKNEDEIIWIISSEQIPPIIGERSYLGNWSVLLFGHGLADASILPRQMVMSGKRCQEAKHVLDSTGADVFIFSMPDDVEWLLAERNYEMP
jgi:hypothetical protein